jgi:hypothetical protein
MQRVIDAVKSDLRAVAVAMVEAYAEGASATREAEQAKSRAIVVEAEVVEDADPTEAA